MNKVDQQIIDSNTTYVDEQAQIGEGTTIYPNTTILGKVKIGKNCEIGPNTVISDSTIFNNCVVFFSVVKNSEMGEGSDIGPFSHLREGVVIGKKVHIGNYCEMKNAVIGAGTKVGHVSYLGDCEIGNNVNIGAGTITANYDGVSKNKTIIENDVFVGSNSVLVAPVVLGAASKIAAGSIVRNDVENKTMVAGVPAKFKKYLK